MSTKHKNKTKFRRLVEEDADGSGSSTTTSTSRSTSTSSIVRRKVNTVKRYFCLGSKKQNDEECENIDDPDYILDPNANPDPEPQPQPESSNQSKLLSLTKKAEKSIVWNYFVQAENRKYYKCNICKKSFTNCNNTSNLLNHLKRKHTEIMAELRKNKEDSQNDDIDVTPVQSNPGKPKNYKSTLNEFFLSSREVQKYDKNSPIKRKLDRYFVKFVCEGYHPLSIADEKGFIDLVHILNPKYKVPSRKVLTQTILPELYNECKANLLNLLNKANSVGITADCWTSIANENYLGITCHFFSPDQENVAKLISSALGIFAIEQNEKADTLASLIKDVLIEFNLNGKVSHITSDNAANMKAAANLLQLKHLPCFAHTLNLVLRSALSTSEDGNNRLQLLITKCKTLVTFFHCSPKATKLLQSENEHLLEEGERKPTKLVQYIDIRWHTLLRMFLSISDNAEGIKRVCIRKEYAHLPTRTTDDMDVIKDLIQLLKPLEMAITELSGHLYISVSMIIPSVKGLCITFQNVSGHLSTDIGKMVLANIMDQIRKRLQPYETRTITRLATLLDARFGKSCYMSESNYESSQQAFREALKNFLDTHPIDEERPVTSTAPVNDQCDSILSFVDSIDAEYIRNNTSFSATTVRNYVSIIGSRKPNRKKDPLQFLKSSFPELYPVALNILSVPASSVPAEALFSSSGLLITDRRNRLSHKNDKFLNLEDAISEQMFSDEGEQIVYNELMKELLQQYKNKLLIMAAYTEKERSSLKEHVDASAIRTRI